MKEVKTVTPAPVLWQVVTAASGHTIISLLVIKKLYDYCTVLCVCVCVCVGMRGFSSSFSFPPWVCLKVAHLLGCILGRRLCPGTAVGCCGGLQESKKVSRRAMLWKGATMESRYGEVPIWLACIAGSQLWRRCCTRRSSWRDRLWLE